MNKKNLKGKHRHIVFIKNRALVLFIGAVLLFILLSFGSGIAVNNYVIKSKIQPTPSIIPTTPTDTLTPTTTIIPTQKPQATYSVEQCLRDMEAFLAGFKKTGLSQGYSESEVNAFIEMARAAETQKCNSGYYNKPYVIKNITEYDSSNSKLESELREKENCNEKLSAYAKCMEDYQQDVEDYQYCLETRSYCGLEPSTSQCMKPYFCY